MNETYKVRFLLSIVFLDGMVMGIVIPAMPLLVADLGERPVEEIVIWGGILTAAFGTAQFFSSPWLGKLSDAVGRQKVLLIALSAMAAEFVIFLTAHSIWLLVLARIIGGAGSANRAVISAAIADIFHDSARSAALGTQTAAFASGLVFGPTLGALALLIDPVLPFIAALALILANIFIGVFFMRETLSLENSRPITKGKQSGLYGLTGFRATKRGALRAGYILYSMAFVAYPSLWSYYAQGILGWSSLKTGLLMTMFCVFLVIANLAAIKAAERLLGRRLAIDTALALSAAAACGLAVTSSDAIILLLFPVIALATIADALLLASYADTGTASEQGFLQGQMSALRAAAIIIAPPVLSSTMAWTNGPSSPTTLHGGMFFLVAALYLGALYFHRLSGQRT